MAPISITIKAGAYNTMAQPLVLLPLILLLPLPLTVAQAVP